MRPSLLLELITKVFAVELTPLDTELILNVVKRTRRDVDGRRRPTRLTAAAGSLRSSHGAHF